MIHALYVCIALRLTMVIQSFHCRQLLVTGVCLQDKGHWVLTLDNRSNAHEDIVNDLDFGCSSRVLVEDAPLVNRSITSEFNIASGNTYNKRSRAVKCDIFKHPVTLMVLTIMRKDTLTSEWYTAPQSRWRVH